MSKERNEAVGTLRMVRGAFIPYAITVWGYVTRGRPELFRLLTQVYRNSFFLLASNDPPNVSAVYTFVANIEYSYG